MEGKNVVISIILGLLMIGLGVGAGMFYQSKMASPSVATSNGTVGTVQGVPQSVKDLSSKVVSSISAYGVVTKIEGRNVTLTQGGDTMTVAIAGDAKIYSFDAPSASTTAGAKPVGPTNKLINLSDIKIGNSASANLRVLPSGQVEGTSLVILSPSLITTPSTPAK